MFVEHILVDKFKEILDNIYLSTSSLIKFFFMQSNIQ
jgi:hypothetical protein